MSVSEKNRERKFHLWGWAIFLVCAGFFIAAAISSGSMLGLAGSLVFLVGCVIFIIPLVSNGNKE